MLSPAVWLMLALGAATPFTYGVMWIKREIAVRDAYRAGERAGAIKVAAAISEAASKREEAFEAGWREPAPIPADRQRIIELCAKSASCRDRGK